MSPEDIARAFVACPGWAWLSGMQDLNDRGRVLSEDNGAGFLWYTPGCAFIVRAPLNEGGLWLPDTDDPATLAIIAHALLPKCWPGHSVAVELFPDGTARVMVFKPLLPGVWGVGVAVFRISHEPVAVSLLRCLEAAP